MCVGGGGGGGGGGSTLIPLWTGAIPEKKTFLLSHCRPNTGRYYLDEMSISYHRSCYIFTCIVCTYKKALEPFLKRRGEVKTPF